MWAVPFLFALTTTLAQAGDPAATPTPYPRQEVPERSAAEAEPAAPAEKPEPVAPAFVAPVPAPARTVRPSIPDPVVVPSLGIAAAFQPATRYRPGEVSFPVWAGVGLHGLPGRTSIFTAAGVEIDMHPSDEDRRGYVMWVPQTRFGVAFLRGPVDRYFNVAVPNAAIYGIAGWKIGNDHEAGAARLGFGVTSPWLLATIATAGSCPAAIPSMFEVTRDLDGRTPWTFRMGWSF